VDGLDGVAGFQLSLKGERRCSSAEGFDVFSASSQIGILQLKAYRVAFEPLAFKPTMVLGNVRCHRWVAKAEGNW
jgi:hypothetical protein